MKKNIYLILVVLLLIGMIPTGTAFANTIYFSESFESNFSELPTGWSYYVSNKSGNVSKESNIATDGTSSLRMNDVSLTGSIGIKSDFFAVTPNLRYTLLVDVYAYTGACSIYLRFFDDQNQVVSDRLVYSVGTEYWMTLELDEFAPKNAVKGIIILYSSVANTGEFLFDNLIFGNLILSDYVQSNPPSQTEAVNSSLVTPKENALTYAAYNEMGDQFSDFSYAGFYGGAVDLPRTEQLPLGAMIFPSADIDSDDTERIQTIIDNVASQVPKGQMQVVKLKEGRYNINSKGLSLKSGVVLSGSGQGPNGTILYAKDSEQYTALSVFGSPSKRIGEMIEITDNYVKAGSNTIHINEDRISDFKVGDLITIYHPSTSDWITGIKMSPLTNIYGEDTSWTANKVDMPTERTIKAINGAEITLDFPLFVPLNKTYSKSYVYLTDDSSKIEHFGIENLRLESYYNGTATDEAHSNYAIAIYYAKNGFVRDISAKYFVTSAVRCARGSKQITIQNCSSLQPVSQIVGSRRYSFSCAYDAQQILFTGCYSFDGRHDYTASYNGTGPLVFLDCVADMSNQSSETHGVWTTGLLYDNVYHTQPGGDGFMAFPNAGALGTPLSHGWSTAGSIAWNCLTHTFIGHKPSLTYQNFMIGVFGRFLDPLSMNKKSSNISSYKTSYRTNDVSEGSEVQFETNTDTPFAGDAFSEAKAQSVEPRSLLKAQLAQRLTGDFRKTKPNAPIFLLPKAENQSSSLELDFQGIYQKGAEAVTIYIDDIPYQATLDPATYQFSLLVDLSQGWHKIYVTQTIQGVEGTKNADRFVGCGISIGEADAILESSYSREKTALILDDSRLTFDQFMIPQKSEDEIISELSTLEFDFLSPQFSDREVVLTQNGQYIMDRNLTYKVALSMTKDFSGWTIVDYGINVDGVNYSASGFRTNEKYGVMFYGEKISKGMSLNIKPYAVYQNRQADKIITVYGKETRTKDNEQINP